MQSKWIPKKLLSYRSILIVAPSLLAMTAIAAVVTSMTMGRDANVTAETQAPGANNLPVQNAVGVKPEPIPTIQAQPVDPDDNQNPLTEPNPLADSDAPETSPALRKQSLTTPSTSTQATSIAKSKAVAPKPVPRNEPASVLTMKALDPTLAQDVPEVPIRVAIAQNTKRFTVATSEEGLITDENGRVMANLPAQNAVGMSWEAGAVRAGNLRSQSPLWIQSKTENGLVFINGRWYRGSVKVIPDDGALLAVNHVELQPYLYSVVGAEMYQSWPLHALKAQAIAARSYALVHIVRPASAHFDLGSTQRWQAYKGVNSEAGSTRTAVDQTRGIVISHQGGIVETLYASSAELVREAHKGFGMSQYGARDLAQQNLTYRQILNRFYPGTELSLLQNQ